MVYSRAFFDFQLMFVRRLVERFDLTLSDALYHYTTFTKSFGLSDWSDYIAGLGSTTDATEWTYQWYLARRSPDAEPHASLYHGNPLFGCFYFVVRDDTVIRPHFINNDLPGIRPLSRERLDGRRAELRRMFRHIKAHVPQARAVQGNSWLYNLDAYCRLFPPEYTFLMPISTEHEFQFLALWGQCFDRHWQVRSGVTDMPLQRVNTLSNLADLRLCFPYKIRQPRCSIDAFYAFYRDVDLVDS